MIPFKSFVFKCNKRKKGKNYQSYNLFRCPYQAKVINTFETTSKPMVKNIFIRNSFKTPNL